MGSKGVTFDVLRKKDRKFSWDKYGRLLAVFYAAGKDVADTMINTRLAE